MDKIETLTAEFTEELAKLVRQEVVETVTDFIAEAGRRGPTHKVKPKAKASMACRHPGCKNRSKGPRFKYFCDAHLVKPKAAKKKARKPAIKAKAKIKPSKPRVAAKPTAKPHQATTVKSTPNGAITQA